MSRILKRLALCLTLVCLLSQPAFAGFEEGRKFYNARKWKEAILHLRPLAEKGDDRAMMLLGNMYNEGFGVERNYREALSLYKKAATIKNNTEAMIAVATSHLKGLGVPASRKTALQWFERSADLGNQGAAFLLAIMLYQGNNDPDDLITPDHVAAYKWLKVASLQDDYPKFKQASAGVLEKLAVKLTAEQVAEAEKAAAAWKPADPEKLPPLP